MVFESTEQLLRRIISSLERDPDTKWDEHLEDVRQCVFELSQMSRNSTLPKGREELIPLSHRASRAIPHVKLMSRAIRQQHRALALHCGRAAVCEMNGMASAPADLNEAQITLARVVESSEKRIRKSTRATGVRKARTRGGIASQRKQ